jgi:hypothetical protein
MSELIGKINTIDVQKRAFSIHDKDQALHVFKIPESLDIILARQKVGYSIKIMYEGEMCKKIEYAPKPADWPQGKAFQKPRNEKLIVVQSLHRDYTDLYIHSMNPEQIDFNEGRRLIIEAVREDLGVIISLGGEQK